MQKLFFDQSLSKNSLETIYTLIKEKSIKKILITGSTGVGKSTLAQKIFNELNIEHIQVDKLYWTSLKGGNTNPNFEKDLERNLAKESYIVEGLWKFVKNFKQKDEFDLHIHLKLPARVQLKQLIQRDIKEFILGKRKTFDTLYFLKNHF